MSESDDRGPTFASPPCFLHEVTPEAEDLSRFDARQQTDVRRWRSAERHRLRMARQAVRGQERVQWEARIQAVLKSLLLGARGAVVSWYWPIRGEPDLRPLMRWAAREGWTCVLPVVVAPMKPLVFRRWMVETPMARGVWDIPVPIEGEALVPDVLLAPVVGFDDRGFRLGNGGGYFDRTLAAMTERRYAVGVGFSFQEIPTIYPQWHDVPMDRILTERDAPPADRPLANRLPD